MGVRGVGLGLPILMCVETPMKTAEMEMRAETVAVGLNTRSKTVSTHHRNHTVTPQPDGQVRANNYE
jgi:hypothetical protein